MGLTSGNTAVESDIATGANGALAAGMTSASTTAQWRGGLTNEATRTFAAHLDDFPLSAKTFGAKGDGAKTSGNASITSGQATLTLTGASFATTDAGKAIIVPGAGAAGAPLVTTIASRTSATIVVLSANASTTLSAVSTTVTYGTDDTTALQNWINDCLAYNRRGFLPAGYYIITAGLTLNDIGGTPRTIHIQGAGSGYSGAAAVGGSAAVTTLDHSAVFTTPGLRWVSLRASTIGDILFMGPNLAATAFVGTEPSRTASDYVSAWCRDSRYSPQCALGGDVLGTSAPPDGGYPGLPYTGSTGGTSDLTIYRVAMRNQVVGVMLNCSTTYQQGDSTRVLQCRVDCARIAYAHGQAQTNTCSLEDLNAASCHTALDGNTYGQQQGAPAHVRILVPGYCYQVLNITDAYKMVSINGVYAESVKTLGNIGSGASTSKQIVVLSNIGLQTRSDWKQAPFVLWNSAQVKITGLVLTCSTVSPPCWNFGGTGSIHIEELSAKVYNYQTPAVGWSADFGKKIGGRNWYVWSSEGATGGVSYWDGGDVGSALPNRCEIHPAQLANAIRGNGANYDAVLTGLKNTYTTVTGAASWSVDTNARTVTFVSAANFVQYVLGDLLLFRITLANVLSALSSTELHYSIQVASIDAGTGTIVCNMIFDPASYDATYNPAGNSFVGVTQWATGALTLNTVTITSGSASITGVTNSATVLRVGDWVLGSGGALPLCRVTATGGTTTVSKNATGNNSGASSYLYLAQVGTRTVTVVT